MRKEAFTPIKKTIIKQLLNMRKAQYQKALASGNLSKLLGLTKADAPRILKHLRNQAQIQANIHRF